LPQALGETQEAAVGRQKEEEEPRIRIEERWPISVIIVSDSFMRLIKKYFSRPEHIDLIFVIGFVLVSNPLEE
jgi:hypothetical protein